MAERMSCIVSTGRIWKLYETRSFHFDIATAARTRWYRKGVVPTLIGMHMIEDIDNNEKGPGKNKRKWTDAEDKELVYAVGTHKADNGFKLGFLGVIEAVLKQKLPGSGIKAKPHIDSRITTMKKDFCVVYDMLNGKICSGFGWDPQKNVVVAEDEVWNAYVKRHKGAGQWSRSFPHYEMFCTIFRKDRATGKGAASTEDVLVELTKNEENEDTQNLGMDFVEMEQYTSTVSTNNEGTRLKGKRRRSTDNMDGFREAARIIGNKIDEKPLRSLVELLVLIWI